MYATPLGVQPAGGGFMVPLTFSEASHWHQNIRAAGGCVITSPGWTTPRPPQPGSKVPTLRPSPDCSSCPCRRQRRSSACATPPPPYPRAAIRLVVPLHAASRPSAASLRLTSARSNGSGSSGSSSDQYSTGSRPGTPRRPDSPGEGHGERLLQRNLVLPLGPEVIGVRDLPARRHGIPDLDRVFVPGLLQAHERVAVLLLPYLEQVQVVAVHVTKIISGACCVHKETLLPARTVPG